MVSKKDIRKIQLIRRENMSAREWDEKSHEIFKRVVNHPFFLETDVLYSYVDYKHEVQTRAIIEHAWYLGKKVAVPKIMGDEMFFYYIHSFDDLREGFRGILEPVDCELACHNAPLVLMPGVAFDQSFNRIGYGRGFYDKFLKKHPDCHTIALGFELQFVSNIPCDDFDIRPEFIITEVQTYVNPIAK